MFEAINVALQFVTSLRPVVDAVAERDAHLTDQLWRAATGAAFGTAEAGSRVGRDRRYRARLAPGECAEALAAVRIALAWGWVDDATVTPALALGDRLKAMLYRLANPRR